METKKTETPTVNEFHACDSPLYCNAEATQETVTASKPTGICSPDDEGTHWKDWSSLVHNAARAAKKLD